MRDARKIVWRDRGELPAEIHDLWECFKHAAKGGLSELGFLVSSERRNLTVIGSGAGSLAFITRAGVNLILLLPRLKRVKRHGL